MDALGSILFAVVLGLVTFRLAMFATFDAIFDVPREWVHKQLLKRNHPKLLQLVSCHVCLSVWFAAAVTAITLAFTDVPLPVWTWLGALGVELIAWRIVNPTGD